MDKINIQDGWIMVNNHFYSEDESLVLLKRLSEMPTWEQGTVKLFGKHYATPRLESFHAEEDVSYGYSGQRLKTHPFNETLNKIHSKLFNETGFMFNSVLCNLYRDGNDSNGWHADNEPELGQNPVIASISFGITRRFDLKHEQTDEKLSFNLTPGSLLIMGGSIQHHWKHRIAKSKKVTDLRINLTFRMITD